MKVLRAAKAVNTTGVSLIPVEWLEVTEQQDDDHAWLQACKEVVAVVVCDAKAGMRMLDMNGEPLPVEDWLPRIEGLEASLQDCKHRRGN